VMGGVESSIPPIMLLTAVARIWGTETSGGELEDIFNDNDRDEDDNDTPMNIYLFNQEITNGRFQVKI